MKRDNVNYLIVGAVVLGALGLLFVVLNRITGAAGATDAYYAYYDRVAGIRYGTPIYFEGYRVGQVQAVEPEHDGMDTRFRVRLEVSRGWPVPSDSIAEAAAAGLLSDVFIYIHEGQASEALAPGARIESREAADLFAALSQLAGEARRLTESELTPLLELLGERVDRITAPLEDGTPEIVSQLRELLARLASSAGSLEEVLGPANRDRLARSLANLERSTSSAAVLAEELRGTRSQLDDVLAQARGLIADNRPEVRRVVENLELTIDQLSARLDNIAFNLDEASRNFNEFTRAIRTSPNRLLFTPPRNGEDGEEFDQR